MTTFTQGKIYVKLDIEPGTSYLVFPDSVIGGVKPGALDNLARGSSVIWGRNMEQEIESGVIGKNIQSLMLGAKYKHQIDPTIINPDTILYLHIDNLDKIPKGWERSVFIWRDDRPFETTDFPDSSYIDMPNVKSQRKSDHFSAYGTFYIARVFTRKLPSRTTSSSTSPDNERIDRLEKELAETRSELAIIKQALTALAQQLSDQ